MVGKTADRGRTPLSTIYIHVQHVCTLPRAASVGTGQNTRTFQQSALPAAQRVFECFENDLEYTRKVETCSEVCNFIYCIVRGTYARLLLWSPSLGAARVCVPELPHDPTADRTDIPWVPEDSCDQFYAASLLH